MRPSSQSGYAATVVESGGGLRELTYDGVPVLAGYPVDSMPGGRTAASC